jgi:signal transduction histidine kinase
VECPRVCVIDNSPAIRETIPIVLGADYTVQCLTADEYLRAPSQLCNADLLVVADDALPLESVTALAHGPPVLWLQSRTGPPRLHPGQSAAIPRWFSPGELRARVEALLTKHAQTQPPPSTWPILEYPVLPKDVVDLARQASGTHFPVLICGEPGTGKTRLARAIHALGGEGEFVVLSATNCTPTALRHAGGTIAGNLAIFVHDVAEITPDGQELLLEVVECGGFHSDTGWHRVRLIGATSRSLEGLGRMPGFDKELFYRLSVLPITLPPLRERTHDLPALSAHIAAELARLQSRDPVAFTERAMERLTHYLWFGNLTEFETVLTRTSLLAPSQTIDAEDLLFGYGRIVPRGREEAPAPARGVANTLRRPEAVDLIINELAHDFKNPMATIKTVAQHLERLLEDPTGREQAARLTAEAVDRMDHSLENMLQFTRFRRPAPQETAVGTLLAPCLTNLGPMLTERRIIVQYPPPAPTLAFVDAAQLSYAFENLIRAVVRDLEEGQPLSLEALGPPPVVRLKFAATRHPVVGKLPDILDHPASDEQAALPLGLVFAKTLVERNGGRIEISTAGETATIVVRLPSRDEFTPGNGKTKSLDR